MNNMEDKVLFRRKKEEIVPKLEYEVSLVPYQIGSCLLCKEPIFMNVYGKKYKDGSVLLDVWMLSSIRKEILCEKCRQAILKTIGRDNVK